MKMKMALASTLVTMLVLAAGPLSASKAESAETDGDELHLGFAVSGKATAKDTGLPQYPGSKPYKDASDESSSAAKVGFSTPLFGLRVVAMKLETRDPPEKVAAFYRQALSKYGEVLECSDATASNSRSESRTADSNRLVCDPDEPGEHSVVYKAGIQEKQRVVAIKPHGPGTRFNLVYVHVRDEARN